MNEICQVMSHIKGEENIVAGTISRVFSIQESPKYPYNFEKIYIIKKIATMFVRLFLKIKFSKEIFPEEK